MIVHNGHVDAILRIAGQSKREACGFILSNGGVLEVPNLADGSAHFLMDPVKQLESWDAANVIWHTHPTTDAIPSSIDVQMFDLVYGGKAMLVVAVQTGRWTLMA